MYRLELSQGSRKVAFFPRPDICVFDAELGLRYRAPQQRTGAGPVHRLLSGILACLLLAGCVALPASPTATGAPEGRPPPAMSAPVIIYAPATPSSIPVLLAAERLDGAEVTIFANHTQANALFVRGDVHILVTGLAVGVDLFKNGVPVQAVNSYVAGLTYLVTYGTQVENLADLKGKEIYVPFEGSPIEEILQFFAAREELSWKTDLKPVYSPFTSSVELLKQGKAAAVALPEPYVSLIESQPNLLISLSFRERWDALTGSTDGYPQVISLVKADWAASHSDVIAAFNAELAAALRRIEQDPAAAVAQVQAQMGLPAPVLFSSLRRTDFAFSRADKMAESIRNYYRVIGKPLDETFDPFFYDGP